jgi:hypothetical protein
MRMHFMTMIFTEMIGWNLYRYLIERELSDRYPLNCSEMCVDVYMYVCDQEQNDVS